MIHRLKVIRFIVLLSFGGSALSMMPDASAQTEVSAGSSLRKQLFDLARPQIEREAKQTVRFQGSLKQLEGWAFFIGTIVKPDGTVIPVGPAESGDTAILWVLRNGRWSVVEAVTGFTDVIYLDWATKHQAPAALFGS